MRGTRPETEKNSISADRVFCTRKSTSAVPRTTPTTRITHVQLIRVGPRATRCDRLASRLSEDATEAFTSRDLPSASQFITTLIG